MYRSSRLVRQPNAPVGINHSNPLAKGIAIAITSQGGATIDAVSGALPASGNGTRAASAYSFGKARQYTSGSDWFLTPASLNAPTRYSWMVRAKFTSISGFNGIFCKTANLGTTNGFGTFRDSGAGDNIVFSHDAGTGTVFEAASNLVNAGLVTIVVTWDGATARYYRDGRFVASGAYTTLVTSGNGYLKVCSNRDTSTTSAYHDHTIVWPGRVLREQEAEYLSLGDNSYSLFTNRRIWVPVAAGGAPVLITATPGNAVAAGVQARVNQAHQVTGTAGNAVANGVAARINQARAVVGTAGNATAEGVAARIDQARQITGTAGNAVADGEAASIYLGRLITATPGDAAAAGVAATIFNGAVIQATPGNAAAAGVAATIFNGAVIQATPGNAAAAGVAATIFNGAVIQATPGDAVAAGRPATILGDQIIVGNAGNATAAGVSAQVGQNRRITGNAANATAEGLLASIYAGVTVQATPAAAVADGVDATVLQAITVSATAGNAVAAGRTARIIEGETPIYAAIPASRKARGRFGERPAQLSTGRRR